nr:phospho-N-acetylmuramoyl-pentapeptide-transferase [Candidatus Cloacimonadota bacterium]
LTLGGLLALISIILREELFFAMIGSIFIAETLSSMIQRYYFKYSRMRTGTGVRFFKKAPLHHHFEMSGVPEEKIVVRFWIIAILLVAIGLGTLKLR